MIFTKIILMWMLIISYNNKIATAEHMPVQTTDDGNSCADICDELLHGKTLCHRTTLFSIHSN
jgi:hypothetical protein